MIVPTKGRKCTSQRAGHSKAEIGVVWTWKLHVPCSLVHRPYRPCIKDVRAETHIRDPYAITACAYFQLLALQPSFKRSQIFHWTQFSFQRARLFHSNLFIALGLWLARKAVNVFLHHVSVNFPSFLFFSQSSPRQGPVLPLLSTLVLSGVTAVRPEMCK